MARARRRKRRVYPLRRTGPYDNAFRDERLAEQASLAERIRAIDRQLVLLSRERAELATRTRAVQDELFPPDWEVDGRVAEPHTVAESLPPVHPDAEPVYGRRLRTLCLRFLHRVGRCTLRRLHILIHLHGYQIDAANPVKALADALGHEADAGRAHRVARGVYECDSNLRYRPSTRQRLDSLVVPFLDELDDAGPDLDLAS